MQVGEHDQYIVRMDGSRRLSLRNRKYLRKIKPYDTRLFGAGSPSVSHNPVHTTVLDKEVDVVGASVVETGFASGGNKVHSTEGLNSTMSIATKPFPLLLR